MAWRVKYRKSLNCVEYEFSGPNSGADIQAATTQGIATGKKYGTLNYLVDLTLLEFVGSIIPLLELSAEQYEIENLDRQSRIALVLPESGSTRKDALFYETASINRGWNVRSFPSRSEALNWLTTE